MILHVQSLRGLAAIGVVIHHSTFTSSFLNLNFLVNLHFFVDFFFILSGYILAFNYEKLVKNSTNFIVLIKKRIIRLYPLHLIILAIFLFIELTKYNFFGGLEITKYNFKDLAQNIFLVHGFSGQSFNLPSWSISVELWVNFLYLILLFYTKNYKLFIFIFLLLALFYLGFYSYHFKFIELLLIENYLNLFRGISGFFLGVFLYNYYDYFKKINFNFFILNIVLFLVFIFNSSNYLIYNFLFFIYLNSALRIKKETKLMKFLENKFFMYLGKISYSIYLWHFLIIHLFDQLIFSFLKIERYFLNELLVFIFSLYLIFYISKFSFEIIENKFSIFLKKKII